MILVTCYLVHFYIHLQFAQKYYLSVVTLWQLGFLSCWASKNSQYKFVLNKEKLSKEKCLVLYLDRDICQNQTLIIVAKVTNDDYMDNQCIFIFVTRQKSMPTWSDKYFLSLFFTCFWAPTGMADILTGIGYLSSSSWPHTPPPVFFLLNSNMGQ